MHRKEHSILTMPLLDVEQSRFGCHTILRLGDIKGLYSANYI